MTEQVSGDRVTTDDVLIRHVVASYVEDAGNVPASYWKVTDEKGNVEQVHTDRGVVSYVRYRDEQATQRLHITAVISEIEWRNVPDNFQVPTGAK